jgi:hypothetical protein
MIVEITPAKIGRSMKNLDRLMARSASERFENRVV